MEFILSRMLRGYDPRIVIRRKDFASLYRKILSMKESVEKKTGKPLEPLASTTEESSSVVARANGDSADDSVPN
ncbi:MAG: hypothetical protein AAB974_02110 [Patescibacteria group bacterium]